MADNSVQLRSKMLQVCQDTQLATQPEASSTVRAPGHPLQTRRSRANHQSFVGRGSMVYRNLYEAVVPLILAVVVGAHDRRAPAARCSRPS
jgi:hypothetical protein